ncbi:MAG TPA: VWA domain-containing protein [Spirochaetota bacterium]|nr:VWA domain-containing protein [Spirochaetota bacterium]
MSFKNIDYLLWIIISGTLLSLFAMAFMFYRFYVLKTFFSRVSNIRFFKISYFIRSTVIILIIALFAIVVLRPQWGFHMREKNVKGTDVLVALDVSRSMNSRDVAADRLSRAKQAIRYIVESVPGRSGLIVFAGEAFLQCPLTTDKAAFSMFLDYTDTNSVALQGTDIGKALDEAERVFEKKQLTNKVLILLSDGEDHEKSLGPVLSRLQDNEVTVYTVGIGTDAGDLVPVVDSDNAGVYLKDSSGNIVKSVPDRKTLKDIASRTGGSFTDISASFSGLKRVIDALNSQTASDQGSRFVREPNDQFQYFAVMLVILMIVELLLNVCWKKQNKRG